jgi:tetratricopeptide (TPR) repeat protein
MNKEPEKMQDGSEFQQILQRYEDMVKLNTRYFFDVEEFEDIIDYYLDVRNFSYAYKASELAITQHPGSFDLQIKLVHIHLESGKPVQALHNLNNFPDYEKEHGEFYLLKGTALAQLGKIREAEKSFDIALSKTEEDLVDVLMNISIAFESAKNYKLSLKYLQKAYEEEPENLPVLYDIAYYYERIRMYKESLEFYNKYLDVDPFSENVWYNLGVLYYKLNRSTDAHVAYDYAIAINPRYPSPYFNKANVYANDGEYSKAINIYKEFLELEPDHLQGYCYLGECYEEIGKYSKALEIYQKVISIDNTFAEGWYGAGLAYMSLEKYNDALSYILKAIDFERENIEFWFALGEIYEKTDRLSDAAKCYTRVVQLDKEDREAWIRLAAISISENNIDSSLTILREAYQWNMGCQDIIYMLSAVYFLNKDHDAGLHFFEKGLEIGEGGLKVFFEIYPEGRDNSMILKLLK